MTALLTTPFNLIEGDLVVAIVDALNEVGYSPGSTPNSSGARARTRPHDPLLAPIRGSNTNEGQVEVIIPTHTADGGSTMTSYGIEIDSDDGNGF